MKILQKLDIWLCLYARPLWFRLWWRRLWIREDEFHESLSIDTDFAVTFNFEKYDWYLKDLTKRREIAHQRELETS